MAETSEVVVVVLSNSHGNFAPHSVHLGSIIHLLYGHLQQTKSSQVENTDLSSPVFYLFTSMPALSIWAHADSVSERERDIVKLKRKEKVDLCSQVVVPFYLL